jgi:adenylate cyclase
LQGALTLLDDGLHLSLRCVNTRRGSVFWAAQFGPAGVAEGRLSDWIGRAVGGLQSSIQIAEMHRGEGGSDGDPEAGNHLLEALAFASALEPVANRRALAILGRILDDEPDEPRALALAAWCYAQRCVYNWSANVDADRREAESLAIAATLGGADDPNCLTVIAAARSLIADHHGAGLLLSRALQINPHSSSANARSGWLANYQDQPDRAIRRFQWALELAPFDPAAFNSLIGLGVAYFIRTEYGTAISHMEKGLALNPHAIWAYRNLVPAYVAAGRQADAERGIHTLLNEHPSLSVAAVDDAMVFSGPMMARLSDGLARAGLSPV